MQPAHPPTACCSPRPPSHPSVWAWAKVGPRPLGPRRGPGGLCLFSAPFFPSAFSSFLFDMCLVLEALGGFGGGEFQAWGPSCLLSPDASWIHLGIYTGTDSRMNDAGGAIRARWEEQWAPTRQEPASKGPAVLKRSWASLSGACVRKGCPPHCSEPSWLSSGLPDFLSCPQQGFRLWVSAWGLCVPPVLAGLRAGPCPGFILRDMTYR